MTPWLKHWRAGTSEPAPINRRREVHTDRRAAVIARVLYEQTRKTLGDDHPATRARLGRLNYYLGPVPQIGANSIEAVAWYRECGLFDGYLNRTTRRNV